MSERVLVFREFFGEGIRLCKGERELVLDFEESELLFKKLAELFGVKLVKPEEVKKEEELVEEVVSEPVPVEVKPEPKKVVKQEFEPEQEQNKMVRDNALGRRLVKRGGG